MNFLDILIAIPLCFFIYKGWRRGLIFEITSLAGIIVGVWACVHFSTWVAETLNIQGDTGVLIAFFITFAAVVALAYFLGRAIEGIFKMVKLNFLNKLFGALLGMAKCLCVISVLLNFILMIDTHQSILTPKAKEESVLYKPSYRIGNKLTISLKNYIDENYLYFCSTDPRKGVLHFSKTLEEHNAAVAQYWPLWEAYDAEQRAAREATAQDNAQEGNAAS